ncbi:response regulator [Celerinatantimonas yamalensis]|uniref:Response regulator n=1 Tax=Celerinatantimonas yamalensis TaxID=559956 RepID=A0ABW9G6R0_9GAMM
MTADYSYFGKKILIIDDQRAFQVMLKSMLQNFGASDIHFAHSAELAIRMCQKNSYDILLIDYNLGNAQNGAQLLEELRQTDAIAPGTLCLIISGESHKSIVLNALEMEPDDFLTKPFSQNQLNHRVQRASQKRQELLPIYIAFAEQQYQRAIEYCQQYMADKGRYHSICQSLMVEAMIHKKDYQGARSILQEQLKKGIQTSVIATLGHVDYLLGNYQKAIEVLSNIVRDSPFLLSAYDSLALAFRDNGQPDKALNIISRANEISPLSVSRQQIMADLALETNNLRLAKEAFGQILTLARRSVHRGPEHLCNFIRSLIDEAQDEEDLYRKNRLLQEVGNVLFKARHEEGLDNQFDFEAFEGLSQARVLATKGEIHRAKQVLFSSNQDYIHTPKHVPNILLPDTFLTLHSVGEYEYAIPIIEELRLRDAINPLARKAANRLAENPKFSAQMNNFHELNQRGIQAHSEGNYQQAAQLFHKALRIAPGNTGVMLNRIQSLLKHLASTPNGSLNEFELCKQGFQSLEGIQLTLIHAKRLKTLKDEFEALLRGHTHT